MSNQPTPGPSGSLPQNSTRQLLDELDALMQRMLALPVNQDVEQAAATQDSSAPSSVLRRPVRQLPVIAKQQSEEPPSPREPDPEESAPAEDDLATDTLPMPSVPASSPYTTDEAPPEDSPLEEPELPQDNGRRPWGAVAPEVFAALRTRPATILTPRPSPPPRKAVRRRVAPGSWLLAPVLWTNRAFDVCTLLLGPLGRWLRSPGGRTVLGWLGLALLSGAVGWQVLLWTGWTW